MILADDLGYGSANCYGANRELVRTPSIDRLAQEGVRFTDAHDVIGLFADAKFATDGKVSLAHVAQT